MINTKVIASFVMCILFNVLLNSFDHYSDVTLAYESMNYDLGDSLLLSGCRVCHGKSDSDIYKVKETKCQKCLLENYDFQCGNDINVLNRLNQSPNSGNCESADIVAKWNLSARNYDVINDNCDSSKRNWTHYQDPNDRLSCCVKEIDRSNQNGNNLRKRNISNHLEHLDKRILAHRRHIITKQRYDLNYDVYVLSAKSSLIRCQYVFLKYFDSYGNITRLKIEERTVFDQLNFVEFLYRNIKNKGEENEWRFKFSESRKNKFELEKGFTANDGCGFLVQNLQQKFIQNNAEQTCGLDPCLLHLQNLKWGLNISNLDQWKHNTFFHHGKKLGGETCYLLWFYGVANVVPTALNLIFHMFIFVEDLKSGTAKLFEIVFVILFFYPQWRTIRFLAEYFFHKDETQLLEHKEKYSTTFGHVEPFLESAFQVSRDLFLQQIKI